VNQPLSSPLATYQSYLDRGQLAYQVDAAGRPVFFPRVMAPGSGDTQLAWRVSTGRGIVYATTVVHRKGEAPANVALIDLEEGFRMMSRVEDIDAEQVRIGMRVSLRVRPDAQGQALPVFVPEQSS
jgi:uncharacterized OB-fold protein